MTPQRLGDESPNRPDETITGRTRPASAPTGVRGHQRQRVATTGVLSPTKPSFRYNTSTHSVRFGSRRPRRTCKDRGLFSHLRGRDRGGSNELRCATPERAGCRPAAPRRSDDLLTLLLATRRSERPSRHPGNRGHPSALCEDLSPLAPRRQQGHLRPSHDETHRVLRRRFGTDESVRTCRSSRLPHDHGRSPRLTEMSQRGCSRQPKSPFTPTRFTTPPPKCRVDRVSALVCALHRVSLRRNNALERVEHAVTVLRGGRQPRGHSPGHPPMMKNRHELETTEITSRPCTGVAPPPAPRRWVGHVLLRITTRSGAKPAMKTHRSRATKHSLLPAVRRTTVATGLATRNRSHEPLPRRHEANPVSSLRGQPHARNKSRAAGGQRTEGLATTTFPTSTEMSVSLAAWVEPTALPCHDPHERRACPSPECPFEQSARCCHRETPP